MPTVLGIVSRGYFPQELPPAFTSQCCGIALATNISSLPNDFNVERSSSISPHNLLVRGIQRRKLGIPNPTNFFRIAHFISNNWSHLIAITSCSTISKTTPVSLRPPGRAFVRRNSFKLRVEQKAQIRSKSRYLLKTDVNQYYRSIYTHSIPWAIHGKQFAKAHMNNQRLLGNKFDKLIRSSQDKQTIGIPIGPDSSLLIAEIVLSKIDVDLVNHGFHNGIRFIDDYEFGCDSLTQAEAIREYLCEALAHYELTLNTYKTSIIELPEPIESLCISQLRAYDLSSSSTYSQRNKIVNYFNVVFSLLDECKTESLLKYAVSKLRSVTINQSDWTLVENLLLQCIVIDPSTIPPILNHFVRYKGIGYTMNYDLIEEVFNKVIERHAPFGHASEVAWSIWALLVLNLPVHNSSALKVSNMDDSITAILLLDANAKGLISPPINFTHYQTYMTDNDLYGDQWLLAYEANVKNWLRSSTGIDYVRRDRCFSFLKANNVFFYDDTLSGRVTYQPYDPSEDEEY